jgi:hypothetical protein
LVSIFNRKIVLDMLRFSYMPVPVGRWEHITELLRKPIEVGS